ncbi:MAG: hypothetical protein JW794_03055 [Candidatus Cloacimonetes bacterium]|nr:hypothetical protein [Candidatus Cloacimonadota bacterium]
MNKKIIIFILALLLSAFIWFEINLAKVQKVDVQVPITISNAPSALVPITIEPEAIDITIEGKGQDIMAYNLKRYVYHIDLKDVHYGKNYLPIEYGHLSGIEEYNLTIVRRPSMKDILIVMDNMNTMIVPVELAFASEESEKYFLENELDIKPEEIQITGPQSIITQIENILTLPYDINVHVEDPQLSVIQPQDPMVSYETYTLDISKMEPKIIQKTLSLIPIDTPEGVEIFPSSVSIKVSGEQELVSILEEKDIFAQVEFSDSVAVDDDIYITVEVPEGIDLIGQTPTKVRIKSIPK